MEAKSAWTANVWGSGDHAQHESRTLKQGEESCCICLTNPVEVKFMPCTHEVCLECCNRMRAANVFKADAGIKCALCRQYIEMYTDLDGNPSSVPSLQKANMAAAKSKAGRQAGADLQVSVSVPNPARLVPPVAARMDSTWYCDKCRHLNSSSRADCAQCRSHNPHHFKATISKDVLQCQPDEIVKFAKEKYHPHLNKAFAEAGMPWAQGKLGGSQDTVKKALCGKGHERLMRVAEVLADSNAMAAVALDTLGNYSVQNVLEAVHRVRCAAHSMAQQGIHVAECFSYVSRVTASTAFGKLLRALVPLTTQLVSDLHGVHVMLKLADLGEPEELLVLGWHMVSEFEGYVAQSHGLLHVCTLVEQLCKLRFEGGSTSQEVGALLGAMCSSYCANQRSLLYAAKGFHSGPMVVNVIQGALPARDAFKVGWMVATSAKSFSGFQTGVRTLELLCSLKAPDALCSEMARDLAAYTAKALQGGFAELASRSEDEGDKLVRTMLGQLQAHREDDWVEWIISELVEGGKLVAGCAEGRELLQSALSMPTLTPDLLSQHLQRLRGSLGSLCAPLQQQVSSNRASPDRLPRKQHHRPSEVGPFSAPETLRRLPHYMRDGAPQQAALRQQHAVLGRPAQQAQQAGAPTQAAASPSRPGGPPPGFGPPANGHLTFPNGGPTPPIPAPYHTAKPGGITPPPAPPAQPGVTQQLFPAAAAAPAAAAKVPNGVTASPPLPLQQQQQQQGTQPQPAKLPAAITTGTAQPAVDHLQAYKEATPSPPTPPASQQQAPGRAQAPRPPHPSDPSTFFPKATAPAPLLASATAPQPPPSAAAPSKPPPHLLTSQQPHYPPQQPEARPSSHPAPGPHPPHAAAHVNGFTSIPEMLAQLTLGGDSPAISAPPAPATAAAVTSAPAFRPPFSASAYSHQQLMQWARAPRPAGGYRPLGVAAAPFPAATQQGPDAAGGAYAVQGGYAAGGGSAQTLSQPRQQGHGAQQAQHLQQAPSRPTFSYIQQQGALPPQPSALFHPPQPPTRPAQQAQQQKQQPPLPPGAPLPGQGGYHPAASATLFPVTGQPRQQAGGAAQGGQDGSAPVQSWSQQQQQAQAGWATAVASHHPDQPPAASWACSVCTYEHAGREAQFLACALCGAPQAT